MTRRTLRQPEDDHDRKLLADVGSPLAVRAAGALEATATERELVESCKALRRLGGSSHGLLAEALEDMVQESLSVVGAR